MRDVMDVEWYLSRSRASHWVVQSYVRWRWLILLGIFDYSSWFCQGDPTVHGMLSLPITSSLTSHAPWENWSWGIKGCIFLLLKRQRIERDRLRWQPLVFLRADKWEDNTFLDYSHYSHYSHYWHNCHYRHYFHYLHYSHYSQHTHSMRGDNQNESSSGDSEYQDTGCELSDGQDLSDPVDEESEDQQHKVSCPHPSVSCSLFTRYASSPKQDTTDQTRKRRCTRKDRESRYWMIYT